MEGSKSSNLMFESNVAEMQLNFVLLAHSAVSKTLGYVGERSSVLDVGCAWGYMAKLLKPKKCRVVGIEIDKKIAKLAEEYCDQVVVCNLEDPEVLRDNLKGQSFDVIICLDVLEHLVRPDIFLVFLKQFLSPGGKLIVSVPNIARLEYRLSMLFGKFEYEDAGILCRSHLRFFTRHTAKALLSDAGYKIVAVEYTGLASRIKILPGLTAYQFLLIATL